MAGKVYRHLCSQDSLEKIEMHRDVHHRDDNSEQESTLVSCLWSGIERFLCSGAH